MDNQNSGNAENRQVPATEAVLCAGSLLALIASGKARSRAALTDASGLSRATVSHRLSALFATGFLEEAARTLPSGGRPTKALRLKHDFALILVADIGESHIRLAITDLQPEILIDITQTMDIKAGPLPVLTWISRQFSSMLESMNRSPSDVLGIGLGLPAPVDYLAGRVVGPSIMTGWDNFDIRGWLETGFKAPIFAENDVNLMALGEFYRYWAEESHLVFIKAGTGIGSGIINNGQIYRGAQGAAGDIGHIQFESLNPPLCRCGKLGCIEARAAGWAIARDLQAMGISAGNARDVMKHLADNRPEAVRLIRDAGRVLGEVAADVVSVLNPGVIVVGGTLSSADEHLLSGIRELVYQRSLPLATRELKIVRAKSDSMAGLYGAARLVMDAQLHHQRIDSVIEKFRFHRLFG